MAEGISQIVRQALNREDVEGLLSLGAPPDEYEREAELVGQAIERLVSDQPGLAVSPDQVIGALKDVWNRTFGPFSEEDSASREAAFRRVATEIIRTVEGARR